MAIPVSPPLSPMLSKPAKELPSGRLLYEPKWDGFRCIVFRDGDSVVLGSRNERPLTRYFPEVVAAVVANIPERCVLDGEVVIAGPHGLDFDALLNRIHPADSRVRLLAATTPACFVAFDVLALDDVDLRSAPLAERRDLLVQALAGARAPVHVTPATESIATAADWFARFEGAGLDGVMAKPLDGPYVENHRGWTKIKHRRTADCVVAGFRWHKTTKGAVGSLLLGLYDGDGTLHHVGVTSSFTNARRLELVDQLAPYRLESMEGHPWAWAEAQPAEGRIPGGQSRWNAGKDLSFEPLRPELVCEVAYDHLQGNRFRHGTTFQRFRHDREPLSCRYDQLEEAVPAELATVFSSNG
ncbi:MAG: ATP-dependent DNA ligase [Acidimicrobiales bacterium]